MTQAEGATVVASDTGTVTFAGWNVYGYGNLIVVNHGNGYETFYAHLSGMNVSPGQIVYQGNRIGGHEAEYGSLQRRHSWGLERHDCYYCQSCGARPSRPEEKPRRG